MENAINTLRIQNFKSIKDVTMQPRRVNLIIGMPNVGKSNILEAMSLLGAGLYESNKTFLGDVLRYESISNLFYDNDNVQPIIVESSIGSAVLRANDNDNSNYRFVEISDELWKQYKQIVKRSGDSQSHLSQKKTEEEAFRQMSLLQTDSESMRKALHSAKVESTNFSIVEVSVSDKGDFTGFHSKYQSPNVFPKKYVYQPKQPHEQKYKYAFLKPPLGHNLLDTVQRIAELRKYIVDLFKPYGLSMVLRVNERKFEIQKNIEDFVYNYPYSLIADTLQRIIFYLAAIESNDDSVLLFEEPEAHTFPVYTSMLGRKIVESRNNQFFVATHSPYLVEQILNQMLPDEEQAGELAIFLAYYEDYQTKVKQLSDEEVREIRNDSIDVFYNLSRFTPGSNLYA
jgi:AAA15 family ATPase/GTPase